MKKETRQIVPETENPPELYGLDGSSDVLAPIVEFHLGILNELGVHLPPEAAVLDFGCGAGKSVYAFRRAGFRAFGFDIRDDHHEVSERIDRELVTDSNEGPVLRTVSETDYAVPFETGTFDFVFSDQVFEHVRDYNRAFSEIARVLKPGGVSVHIFPSRLFPIEGHVYVPFASVFQQLPYLKLWAFLGIRNEYQRGLDWRTVARLNHEYLNTRTTYLPRRKIETIVRRHFQTWQWADQPFLKHSFGRSRFLYPAARVLPIFAKLYGILRMHVLFLRKNASER